MFIVALDGGSAPQRLAERRRQQAKTTKRRAALYIISASFGRHVLKKVAILVLFALYAPGTRDYDCPKNLCAQLCAQVKGRGPNPGSLENCGLDGIWSALQISRPDGRPRPDFEEPIFGI